MIELDITDRLAQVQGDNEDIIEAIAEIKDLWTIRTSLNAELLEAELEIKRLRAALQNLLECSGHLSVFGGNPSVKAVRQAGKYIKAVDAARSALEPKP